MTALHPPLPPAPLHGMRVLSLALNLPGPAALLRCHAMGASCTKLEPIAPLGAPSADLMHAYSPAAYAQLHAGITVLQANLKTPEGQQQLHDTLAQTDVLITSFRPSALHKLGLDWATLQQRHPQLCMVRIYGSTDPAESDHAGHDLPYQAQAGLTDNGQMPASLFPDMAGALMASEAVLSILLQRAQSGHGHCADIGLAQAAQWLALPRGWNMTTAQGDVGGAHAGYKLYPCADGTVALAALEPHFAQRLCLAAGVDVTDFGAQGMRHPAVHAAIEDFLADKSCAQLEAMAAQSDIPLHLNPTEYKQLHA